MFCFTASTEDHEKREARCQKGKREKGKEEYVVLPEAYEKATVIMPWLAVDLHISVAAICVVGDVADAFELGQFIHQLHLNPLLQRDGD